MRLLREEMDNNKLIADPDHCFKHIPQNPNPKQYYRSKRHNDGDDEGIGPSYIFLHQGASSNVMGNNRQKRLHYIFSDEPIQDNASVRSEAMVADQNHDNKAIDQSEKEHCDLEREAQDFCQFEKSNQAEEEIKQTSEEIKAFSHRRGLIQEEENKVDQGVIHTIINTSQQAFMILSEQAELNRGDSIYNTKSNAMLGLQARQEQKMIRVRKLRQKGRIKVTVPGIYDNWKGWPIALLNQHSSNMKSYSKQPVSLAQSLSSIQEEDTTHSSIAKVNQKMIKNFGHVCHNHLKQKVAKMQRAQPQLKEEIKESQHERLQDDAFLKAELEHTLEQLTKIGKSKQLLDALNALRSITQQKSDDLCP